MKNFFAVRSQPLSIDLVLLLMRVVSGLAFMMHGWMKIQNPFGWMGENATVPGFLLALAALSEFGGGLAWIFGLLTRLASFGLLCTMTVAILMHAFVMHDPFVNMSGGSSFEPATVYFLISLLFLVMGPGRFSADRKIFGLR